MTARRIVLCSLAAGAGIGALVLAHDVHAWRAAVDRGDARFAESPAAARWTAATWLPQGVALGALELRDDLRLRRAEQAFVAVDSAPRGFDIRRAEERYAAVEVALVDVIAGASPRQASREGNLLGILTVGGWAGPDPLQRAGTAEGTFDAAVRADPGNDYAKYNLELLLRKDRVIGTRLGAGFNATGDFGQVLAGAGAGQPGSGY